MNTPLKRGIALAALIFVLAQIPSYRDAYQRARPFSDFAVAAIVFVLVRKKP